MKLLDQKSDEHWTDAPFVGGTPYKVRYHSLKLVAALGDFDMAALNRTFVRPNASEYGGVRAGHLLFRDLKCQNNGAAWDIDVVLMESRDVPFTKPFRIMDLATGEVRDIDAKLYGDPVEFRDSLPTCGAFKPAVDFR